jgi:hypothetical protein
LILQPAVWRCSVYAKLWVCGIFFPDILVGRPDVYPISSRSSILIYVSHMSGILEWSSRTMGMYKTISIRC